MIPRHEHHALRAAWPPSVLLVRSGDGLTSNDLAKAPLDCVACGACCRQGSDGRILVPAEDIVRWRRTGRDDLADALVEGHFSEMAFPARADGSCVHLGTPGQPNACSIYAVRGTTCREFEAGSWQCLEFRREAGIDA
jgi:Fe-S-cluster containining protein